MNDASLVNLRVNKVVKSLQNKGSWLLTCDRIVEQVISSTSNPFYVVAILSSVNDSLSSFFEPKSFIQQFQALSVIQIAPRVVLC